MIEHVSLNTCKKKSGSSVLTTFRTLEALLRGTLLRQASAELVPVRDVTATSLISCGNVWLQLDMKIMKCSLLRKTFEWKLFWLQEAILRTKPSRSILKHMPSYAFTVWPDLAIKPAESDWPGSWNNLTSWQEIWQITPGGKALARFQHWKKVSSLGSLVPHKQDIISYDRIRVHVSLLGGINPSQITEVHMGSFVSWKTKDIWNHMTKPGFLTIPIFPQECGQCGCCQIRQGNSWHGSYAHDFCIILMNCGSEPMFDPRLEYGQSKNDATIFFSTQKWRVGLYNIVQAKPMICFFKGLLYILMHPFMCSNHVVHEAPHSELPIVDGKHHALLQYVHSYIII